MWGKDILHIMQLQICVKPFPFLLMYIAIPNCLPFAPDIEMQV